MKANTLKVLEQKTQKFHQAANKAAKQWNAELKAAIVDGEISRSAMDGIDKFSVRLTGLSAEDVAGLVEYFKNTTADRF
jgi:hypothetical protein